MNNEEVHIPPELAVKLPELRAQHPDLLVVGLFSNAYVIRPLTWREFRSYSQTPVNELSFDQLDEMIALGMLWPDKLADTAPAGIDTSLCSAILTHSAYDNSDSLVEGLNAAREQAKEIERIVVSTICRAFGAYKISDVYNMDFYEMILLYAMAEEHLGIRLGIGDQEDPEPSEHNVDPSSSDGQLMRGHMESQAQSNMTKEQIMSVRERPNFDKDVAGLGRV